jgi:CheY-like chemotaxis protein
MTRRSVARGHVLIVDDDEPVLEVVREIVAGLGYEVSVAKNGAQALAALSAFRPDAVVMDLNMPTMSGAETLDRMRQQWPAVPVIVTAATVDPAVVSDVMARGASDYLAKPVDFARLEQALAAAVDRP